MLGGKDQFMWMQDSRAREVAWGACSATATRP